MKTVKSKFLKAAEILDPVSGVNFKVHTHFSVTPALHTHDFMEIFLISKGAIRHLVNGKDQGLVEGDLVFMRPADTHCYRQYRDSGCELVNLAFSQVLFQEMEEFFGPEYSLEASMDGYLPEMVRLGPVEKGHYYSRLVAGGEKLLQDPADAGMYFKILLAEILNLFKRRLAGGDSSVGLPAWLGRVVSEMRKKENFRKGLPALRNLACRSDEHTARSFRLHLDSSPTEFINGLRIGYAASCLLNSDEKIDSIAVDAGFDNLSHFYHLFKDRYGSSPRKYRMKNRKNAVIV